MTEVGQQLAELPQQRDAEQLGGAAVQHIFVHPDIAVVQSNRHFGNLDPRFSSPVDVVRNRSKLARELGSERMVTVVPYASDAFVALEDGPVTVERDGFRIWPEELRMDHHRYDPAKPPYMADLSVDGFITTQEKVALALHTADCAPLVLWDDIARVLALVHVGREGAAKAIVPKMIDRMTSSMQVDPARLTAYFGPSIAPESYVLKERLGALADSSWDDHLRSVTGGFETDVVGYATEQLVVSGVQKARISQSPVDVASNPDYFSYVDHVQNGVPNGRNGFMVMIKPSL